MMNEHICSFFVTFFSVTIDGRNLIFGNGFRGEESKKISQSETRIACGGHVCKWIGTK
jgi:hypothetical protein